MNGESTLFCKVKEIQKCNEAILIGTKRKMSSSNGAVTPP